VRQGLFLTLPQFGAYGKGRVWYALATMLYVDILGELAHDIPRSYFSRPVSRHNRVRLLLPDAWGYVSYGSEQYLVLHGEVCGSPGPRYTGFRGVNAGILRRRNGHHYWFSARNFAGDCVH